MKEMRNDQAPHSKVCFDSEPLGSPSSTESHALFQETPCYQQEPFAGTSTGPQEELLHQPAFHPEDEYFEGPEKTLEVWFDLGPSSPREGLRLLNRAVLDDICAQCNCEIISHASTAAMDAYVLSESSLFVSPTHFLMKTCGRTTLLCSLTPLLAHVCNNPSLDMALAGVKFSRRSYSRPEEQLFPHRDFPEERTFFEQALAPHSNALHPTQAVCLGEEGTSQWYLLLATAVEGLGRCYEGVTLMMDGMSQSALPWFYHSQNLSSHALRTKQKEEDGLYAKQQRDEEDGACRPYLPLLTPSAHLQDFFLFAPCGFSMNTLQQNEQEMRTEEEEEEEYSTGTETDSEEEEEEEEAAASTDLEQFSSSHITPQHAFSYASWELCGKTLPPSADLLDMLQAQLLFFKPRHFSLTLASTKKQQQQNENDDDEENDSHPPIDWWVQTIEHMCPGFDVAVKDELSSSSGQSGTVQFLTFQERQQEV
jgi:hypothetical protein